MEQMIIETLKEKRRAAKITQEAMAKRLRISRSTYIRVESNNTQNLDLISRAFAELGYRFCIIKSNEITIL